MITIPTKNSKELKKELESYLMEVLDTISLNSPISISSL